MIGTITTVCIEKEKMTMEPKRAQWGSKIGFILAAAGSAVGLGNIWKFPGKAYEGGGGAYILIYLAIVATASWATLATSGSAGSALSWRLSLPATTAM